MSKALNVRLVIGGVVALAVVAGLLIAVVLGRPSETASGDPTSSPSPTAVPTSEAPAPSAASPEPSEDPTSTENPSVAPGPTPVVRPLDGVLPPGAVARVSADALRLREGPTTAAAEVATVGRGQLVVLGSSFLSPISFGPVEADGYVWQPVVLLGRTELPGVPHEPFGPHLDMGWLAMGDGDDVWLELVEPRCTDAEPTLAILQSLTDWERVACYGDRPITVVGVVGCGGCGGYLPATIEPAWLAHPNVSDPLSVEPQDRIGPFVLHWSPEGPARPGEAQILRVNGHFDDPAAGTCSIAIGEPEQFRVDPLTAELYCRSHFVVDSYEVLGVDEDFPLS